MDDKTIDTASTGDGLTAAGVEQMRREYGENVLTPPPRTPLWRLYLEKYNDPIIKILLVAAAVSLALAFVEGEFAETLGIFLAIFLATTTGFYFERDAARRFNMLTSMDENQAVKVVRDGKVCEIARREVVVGDVVVIETGDEVPADGRLFESSGLQIDESALTGEPLADKCAGAEDDGSAYPPDMVLRSTMVMGGTGRMTVTAVGDATEIGRVARQSSEMTAVKTPLNMQLSRLANIISKVGTGVAVGAFVLFMVRDIMVNPLWHTTDYVGMAGVVLRYFMMAVTLIVMAVPEGLPMAVTLALALNMRRMLKSNNLVRKLHACETMGAVTVICTDKTGTLTQNRMQVADMLFAAGGASDDSLGASSSPVALSLAVNTTAELDGDKGIGNPTEVALLLWLAVRGEDYRSLRDSVRVVERMPFSTERKYMATLCEAGGRRWLFVKGAPEIVMDFCTLGDGERERVSSALRGYQSKAMRTLAFACRQTDTMDVSGMTLQGVAAISDPLRDEVPAAVRSCHAAGIAVKIVTGDTAATAGEIARQIGIGGAAPADDTTSPVNRPQPSAYTFLTGPEFAALPDSEARKAVKELEVMSRARPADKRRLVSLLQEQGEIVAVTGDGTNDAPALNHAHVGLSLGSGTSVAKNASDMTLLDDSFNSIVRAVQWGRSLYRNIQRFVFFQLIVNVTALLLVLCGSLIGTELPLTIPQMLWVNLIMDTFAAMALASLPPESGVMKERPRDSKAFIISRSMAFAIAAVGLVFFAVMFILLYYFECVAGVSAEELTVFFTVFVLLQWWNLLNAKVWGTGRSAFHGLLSDRGLLFVLALVFVGQWVIVTFGGEMFRTVPLPWHTWLLMVVCTSPVIIVGEGVRLIYNKVKNN